MSTRVHTRPSARQTPGLRPQTRAPFLLDPQQVKYTAYLFSGLCPTESNPPARTTASGKARENILSEFETTAKAAVEITEARGEGASFEEKGHPESLFLR